MENLSFKEQMMFNIFLKYAGLEIQGDLVVDTQSKYSLLINSAVSFILKNRKMLEEIIIEGSIDKTNKYKLLESFEGQIGTLSEDKAALYKETKEEIIKEYLKDNLDKAPNFFDEFEEVNFSIFNDSLKENLDNNKIDNNYLDRIFNECINDETVDYTHVSQGFNIIFTMILEFTSTGRKDLAEYLTNKLKAIISDKINTKENLTEEEQMIVINSFNQDIDRTIRGGIRQRYINNCLKKRGFSQSFRNWYISC